MEDEPQNDLITWPTAKLAKDCGFRVICVDAFRFDSELHWETTTEPDEIGWLKDGVNDWNVDQEFGTKTYWARPTQAVLQRWLLETHGLHVQLNSPCDSVPHWEYNVFEVGKYSTRMQGRGRSYITVLEKGLQRAFELIPNPA